MFDYLVKVLPNGRLLVRNSHSKTSETLKASEISDYFQNVLEEQIKTEDENQAKVLETRNKALGVEE